MAQTIENIVDPNDSSLTSEMVQFASPGGNINAYVSRPKDGKNLGTVLVIHENRGLVGHIKDVARRFAKEGFAAIAVDCMSRIGGSDRVSSHNSPGWTCSCSSPVNGLCPVATAAVGFHSDTTNRG